jgi:hypothetical protein
MLQLCSSVRFGEAAARRIGHGGRLQWAGCVVAANSCVAKLRVVFLFPRLRAIACRCAAMRAYAVFLLRC